MQIHPRLIHGRLMHSRSRLIHVNRALTSSPALAHGPQNQHMQQVMYETHARAEQLQLERDTILARSREVEEKLAYSLSRYRQHLGCSASAAAQKGERKLVRGCSSCVLLLVCVA